MIVYNVTLNIQDDIADEWVQWMKTTHMKDLMDTGLFVDCRLCRLLNHAEPEADGVTFTAQYTCEGMEQYNRYIDEYAEGFRGQMFKLYGNKFVAFRTLMEII